MNYLPKSPQTPLYLQIRQLLSGLNSKKSQKINPEIQVILGQLGVPGEQFFFTVLLESFEIQKERLNPSQKYNFVNQWLQSASSKSHFIDYFANVLENVCPVNQILSDYLNDLCSCLKIPLSVQILICLSLVLQPNLRTQSEGQKILRRKMLEYFQVGKPSIFPAYSVHPLLSTIKNLDIQEGDPEVKFLLDTLGEQVKQPETRALFEVDMLYTSTDFLSKEFFLPRFKDCVTAVDILRDVGASCCCEKTNQLAIVLKDVLPLNEEDIMGCLIQMVNHVQTLEDRQQREINELFYVTNKPVIDWESVLQSDDKPDKKIQYSWNVDAFIDFIAQTHPQMKWDEVIMQLDRPQLDILEQKTWLNLMSAIAKIRRTSQFVFPTRLILEKWKNKGSQVQFLGHMLRVGKPEVVFWNEIQTKRYVQIDFNTNYRQQLAQPYLLFWCNLDLVQLLVELSDEGYIAEIRELFDIPIKINPDIVILAIAQIQPLRGGPLIDELFTSLFPNYVSQHANTVQVLETLWKHNKNLVIAGISELYRKELVKKDNSCLNLSRVLDITQSISQQSQQTQSLISMAHSGDHNFSVPLGVLAGKREFLNFDRWIQDRIKAAGAPFVLTLLQYLEENVLYPVREQQTKMGLQPGQFGQMSMPILDAILEKAQMKLEMMTIIFEQLLSKSELGQKIRQRTQLLYKELSLVFPALAGPPNPKATQEVERLTDQYFNQFYNETISCEQLLNSMIQWRQLGTLQEKEVCACIITNLFNEYQFHQKYPPKELNLTGILFGGVIEKGLIDGKALGVGLQIINFSIMQTNNRYEFGLRALEQIKPKCWEHQQFTEQLFNSDQLLEKNPELLWEIYNICDKRGVYLNIPVEKLNLLKSKIFKPQPEPEPPKPVIEPILQPQPLRKVVQQQQQLTSQSITPPPMHTQNNIQLQTLTPQPTQKLNRSSNDVPTQSFKDMLQQLFDPCDRDFQEENIKNKITFIINQVAQDNLDERCNELKTLLESYNTQNWFSKFLALIRIPKTTYQQLQTHIYCLMLEKINKRQLFKEVSREVGQALTMLLESNKTNINQDDRNTLKAMGSFLGQITLQRNKPVLNKYFNFRKVLQASNHAIIVICKMLEWSSKSKEIFRPSNVWLNTVLTALEKISQTQQCVQTQKYEIELLFRTLEYASEKPPFNPQTSQTQEMILPQLEPNPTVRGTQLPSLQPPQQTLNIKNLPQYVQVDEKNLEQQMKHVNLHQLIATAMDKAISDIIPPVITRSVTIALITTRELALKDFSLEPDEKKLLRGTHLIVQNLSGSLALVTCREPLKVSIQNHLRGLLKDETKLDNAQKEQIVSIASVDNLDLGCALIKKAVIEKALEDVNQDRTIIDELDKRKTFRDQNIPFFDDQTLLQFQMLPESLQPRQGGLRDEEFRIYEEFASQQKKSTPAPRQQEKKISFVQKVDLLLNNVFSTQLQEVNFADRVEEVKQSPELVEYALDLGERIVELMIITTLSSDKLTSISVLDPLVQKIRGLIQVKWIQLLQQVIEKNVSKLETLPLWYVAVIYFFKKEYFSVQELDQMFVNLLEQYQPTKTGIANVTKQLVIQEQSLTVFALQKTIKALKYSNEKSVNPNVTRFFNDLTTFAQLQQQQKQQQQQLQQLPRPPQETKRPPEQVQSQKQVYLQLSNEVDSVFYELTQTLVRDWADKSSQNQIVDFIRTLEQTVLLKNEENIQKFFVYSVDISCQQATANSEKQLQQIDSLDYSMVDSMSKLIILFIRGVVNFDRNLLMQKILDAVLIVLTRYHETLRQQFNQRPLYKLLFNLIWEIRFPKYNFTQQEIVQLFIAFTHFLEKCNPTLYPAFSFAWLELISNRFLLQAMLNDEVGQKRYRCLILKLLEFLRETINNETLQQESVNTFYKGVIKLFLVVIQCYQNFSQSHAISFTDEIPNNLLQLRNIFLAAYPQGHNYPKPEDVTSFFDIPESKLMPEIIHTCIEDQTYNTRIQEEIFGCFQLTSDEELYQRIHKLFEIDDSQRVPLNISSFFILLPIVIFSRKSIHSYTDQDGIILIQRILRCSSLELRHIIINVILNHLRFPNKITFFYIQLLLTIYQDKEAGTLIEHISTCLIQRITVERPQSWGIKYIHNELIRDPKYIQYQQFSQLIENHQNQDIIQQ